MSFLTIGNINNPPLNNVNGSLANVDNSHAPIPFGSNVNPALVNPNAMPLPGSNVLSAKGIIPCSTGGSKGRMSKGKMSKGRKINRRKINKISRKYKMAGSKKSKSRRIRRMKSRIFKRYSAKSKSRKSTRSKGLKGGAAQAPVYPAGYNQFDNNKVISNNYSTGNVVPGFTSAMANPVTYSKLNGDLDNLNHFAKNDYGNRVGSGFPSRGRF
jgi:hypothetical protein